MSVDIAWKIPIELRAKRWMRLKRRGIYIKPSKSHGVSQRKGIPVHARAGGEHRIHFVDAYHPEGPRVVGIGWYESIEWQEERLDSTWRDRGPGWIAHASQIVNVDIPLSEIDDPTEATRGWQQGYRYVLSDSDGLPRRFIRATDLARGAARRISFPGADEVNDRARLLLIDLARYERKLSALQGAKIKARREKILELLAKSEALCRQTLSPSPKTATAELFDLLADAESYLIEAMDRYNAAAARADGQAIYRKVTRLPY